MSMKEWGWVYAHFRGCRSAGLSDSRATAWLFHSGNWLCTLLQVCVRVLHICLASSTWTHAPTYARRHTRTHARTTPPTYIRITHKHAHAHTRMHTHTHTHSSIEHRELPAKLLDYFLRSNKSNINQSHTHTHAHAHRHTHTQPQTHTHTNRDTHTHARARAHIHRHTQTHIDTHK